MVHWYDYILHIGSPLVKSSVGLILLLPPMFSSLCLTFSEILHQINSLATSNVFFAMYAGWFSYVFCEAVWSSKHVHKG
jgi:hypothetical protein